MKLSVSVCFWGTCGCGCITSLIRQNIELWTTHTGKQAAPPVHPRRLSSSPSNRATSHSSTSSPPPASLTLSYRDGLLAVWLHLTVKSSSEDESRFSSSDGAWQESKGHWTCVVLKTGEAAVPLFSFVKLWRKRWKTFKVCHFLCFLKKKTHLVPELRPSESLGPRFDYHSVICLLWSPPSGRLCHMEAAEQLLLLRLWPHCLSGSVRPLDDAEQLCFFHPSISILATVEDESRRDDLPVFDKCVFHLIGERSTEGKKVRGERAGEGRREWEKGVKLCERNKTAQKTHQKKKEREKDDNNKEEEEKDTDWSLGGQTAD